MDGMKEDLLDKLKEKEFYGIIDKLERGELTEEEAERFLEGDTAPLQKFLVSTRPDPYPTASAWKRQGMGRQESWSRWIQITGLNPGMDAKDWYRLWDSI